mmetsp:Transcript_43794/g.70391  ORF Transcript_43794/g.70391 Transcript_43794/m.70391 type:complete len:695 (-) Transcript_43794:394-2478(-)
MFNSYSVEGIYHFLYLEPKTTQRFRKISELEIAIPDTVIYSRGQPIAWYSKEELGGIKKVPLPEITVKKVLKEFVPHGIKGRRLETHVAAIFQRSKPEDEGYNRLIPHSPVEFLTYSELQELLRDPETRGELNGILQRFIYSPSPGNETMRVTWGSKGVKIERRRCLRDMDSFHTNYDKCVTYEGPLNHQQYDTRNITMTKSSVVSILQTAALDFVRHISQVSRGSGTRLKRLVLHFKKRNRTLYFLWCSSMEMDIEELTSDGRGGTIENIRRFRKLSAGSGPATLSNTSMKGSRRNLLKKDTSNVGPISQFSVLKRINSMAAFKVEQNLPSSLTGVVKTKKVFRCPNCKRKINLKAPRFRVRVESVLHKHVVAPLQRKWAKSLVVDAFTDEKRSDEEGEEEKIRKCIVEEVRKHRHSLGDDALELIPIAIKLIMPTRCDPIEVCERELLEAQVKVCGQCADKLTRRRRNDRSNKSPKPPKSLKPKLESLNPSDEYIEIITGRNRNTKPQSYIAEVTNRLYPYPKDEDDEEVSDIFGTWEKAYQKFVGSHVPNDKERSRKKAFPVSPMRTIIGPTRQLSLNADGYSMDRNNFLYRAKIDTENIPLLSLHSQRLATSPLNHSSRPHTSAGSASRPEWKSGTLRGNPLFTDLKGKEDYTDGFSTKAKVRSARKAAFSRISAVQGPKTSRSVKTKVV